MSPIGGQRAPPITEAGSLCPCTACDRCEIGLLVRGTTIRPTSEGSTWQRANCGQPSPFTRGSVGLRPPVTRGA
jgi:hypothetical protein